MSAVTRRRAARRRAVAAAATLGLILGAGALSGTGPLHALRGLASTGNCPAPALTGVGVSGSPSSGHAPQGATVVLTGSNLNDSNWLLCNTTLTVTIGSAQFSINGTQGSSSSQSFVLNTVANGHVSVSFHDTVGASNSSNSNLVFVTDPTAGSLPSSPAVGQTLTAGGSRLDLGGWTNSASVGYGPIYGACPGSVAASVASGGGSVTVPGFGQFCRASARLTLGFTADTSSGRQSSISLPVGTVAVAASVGSLSPAGAPAGGQVTLSGSGFGTSGSATVGGVAAPSGWTDTSVTVTLPDGGQGGQVGLTRVDGVGINAGSVSEGARIDNVSPARAVPGASVTISGGGFGPGAGSVSVAGTPAAVGSWSPTSVTFTMPAGTHGTSLTLSPTVNSPASAPFGVAAVLSGVSPSHAAPGALVQLTGSGFGPGGGTVTIAGRSATVQLWGDTQVVAAVPAGAAPGATRITLTPPGQTGLSLPFTVDSLPPGASPSTPGSSSSSSSSGSSGASSASSSQSGSSAPSFIAPSAGGPMISTAPVNFQPPPKPAGPVQLNLSPSTTTADPRHDVPFTVTLVAFGKPVSGAKVDVLLVVEPGADARVTPAEGLTDDSGKLTGTLHLSATPGDHILLARSGQYSDEIRVVGRSAAQAATGNPGGRATDVFATITSGPPKMIIVGGLVACLVFFLTGFAIQMLVPRTGGLVAAGGVPVAAARARRRRRSLLDAGDAGATMLQFVLAALAVCVALPFASLARLGRRRRG